VSHTRGREIRQDHCRLGALTDELLAVDDFDVGAVGIADWFVHAHIIFSTLFEVVDSLLWIHVAVIRRRQFDLADVLFQQLRPALRKAREERDCVSERERKKRTM